MTKQALALALLAPLAWATGGGCNRDEQVRVYDVPKQPPGAGQVAGAGGPTTNPAADPHAGRSVEELRRMMAARQAGSPQPQGESVIGWTVPAGWEELQTQAGDMRHAAFAVVPERMDVLVTVTPLGPSDTLANVNRWLGQLGAQPITAAQLPQTVQRHEVNGTPVEEVDLSGPAGDKQQRMLAAIVQRPDRFWFVKLMGPADVVAPQKEKFDQFVHSIRFTNVPAAAAAAPESAAAPAPAANADPGAPAGVQISKYDAPPGWQPQPIPPGSMFPRELSFKVGEGNEAADLAVTKLRAGATGTPLDNVNRWRGQVGLPPLTQLGENDLRAQTINGQPWLTLDVTGPDAGGGQPARRMLVAFTERGGEVWFVKLLGPAAAVGAQQQNFGQFLQSLQFGGR